MQLSEVLTGPVLTNRIEHVTLPTRVEVSTRNVKKIKCGSTEYSKTIENNNKKTFDYYFNPRVSFGWSSYWDLYKDECHVDEIQIHEVTVTDTDDQATLCRVKTTRRTKLDTVQHLSVIAKGKLRNACILNKSSCMRALAFMSENLDCMASQQKCSTKSSTVTT